MKKEYKKPELKEVKLKHRTSLLECSAEEVCNEVGYNKSAADEIASKG